MAVAALIAAPAYALSERPVAPLEGQSHPGYALHKAGMAPRTGGIALRAPQKSNAKAAASDEEPITKAPDGTLHENLVRSSTSFDVAYGQAFTDDVECMVGEFVDATDGYLYVKNPFAFNKTETYMKLKKEGETAVLEGPQLIFRDDIDGSGEMTDLYVMRLKLTTIEVEGAKKEWYMPDSGTIVFDYKDGVLTQRPETGVIYGLTTVDGDWVGFGDWDLKLAPVEEDIFTMPNGLDVKKYSFTHFLGGNLVDVAIDNDMIYIAGFNPDAPQYSIKGKIEGNKVILPGGQYMGVVHQQADVDLVYDYHTYFMPAKVVQEWVEDYGEYVDVYELEDNLELNYNTTTGVMQSDKVALLNAGKMQTYYVSAYHYPKLAPYAGKKPGVPAKPMVTEQIEIKDWYGDGDVYGAISFVLLPYDVDGNYIDYNDLYYNMVINDEVFTFTPEEFVKLSEPMTDVPYYFTDYYDIQIGDEIYHNVWFTNPEYVKIGVHAKYTVDGVTNVSEVAYFGDPVVGVDKAHVEAEVVSTVYTDLAGCRVSNPERGIYIKTVKYSDGTVVNSKVLK